MRLLNIIYKTSNLIKMNLEIKIRNLIINNNTINKNID